MKISVIGKQQSKIIKLLLVIFLIFEALRVFIFLDSRSIKQQHLDIGVVSTQSLSRYKDAAPDAKILVLVTEHESLKFLCKNGRKISCFDNETLSKIKNQEVTTAWQSRDLFFKQLVSVQLENGTIYKVREEYYKKSNKQFLRASIIWYSLCVISFFLVVFLMSLVNIITSKSKQTD